MPPTTPRGRSTLAEPASPGIAAVVQRQLLRAVFQPIVDLRTLQIVGYEALIRGPAGSRFENPGALFAAAHEAGLTTELDWACQASAIRAALRAGVHASRAIFINVEPSSLTHDLPRWLVDLVETARERLTIVLEITERALTGAPAALLGATARIRRRGVSVALDDVGADHRSLALLPFVDPEVVKLDMAVTQDYKLSRTARTAAAVHAHAERSGAHVLAEGIETHEHLDTALALGADLGQGWLFGRPGPLPAGARLPVNAAQLIPRCAAPPSSRTPFELLSTQGPVRRGTKELLLRLSRGIEAQAAVEGEAVVLLSTFQEAAFLTPASREQYRTMALRAALVGALGVGIDASPEPGVHGASLRQSEPLRGEWNVCAVGPHFAAAFVARDLGDRGPDSLRRFDFVLTHDRDRVIAATSALMSRVAGD